MTIGQPGPGNHRVIQDNLQVCRETDQNRPNDCIYSLLGQFVEVLFTRLLRGRYRHNIFCFHVSPIIMIDQ